MDINEMIEDMRKSFVKKYYMMDPATEFMIPTSDLLQNGMEVLIAHPDSRVNTLHIAGGSEERLFDRALERNRWCKVSNLRSKDGTYTFTATYSDGTQRTRVVYVTEAWFVKLSSVDILQRTRDRVLELVNFIAKHDESTCGCVPEALKARVTEDILRIFGMGVSK